MLIPVALSLVVLYSDLKDRKIPNWVVLGLFATGCVYQAYYFGFAALLNVLAIACVVLVVLLPLWRRGGIRGGDVKYLVSLTPWLDVGTFLVTVLIGCLVGILAALVSLYAQGRLFLFVTQKINDLLVNPKYFFDANKGIFVPFGACIAISVIVVLSFAS